MNTPSEIYSNNYLRMRAEQVVLKSIKELSDAAPEKAKQLAADALKDAEQNGCQDMDYLDQLYLATL